MNIKWYTKPDFNINSVPWDFFAISVQVSLVPVMAASWARWCHPGRRGRAEGPSSQWGDWTSGSVEEREKKGQMTLFPHFWLLFSATVTSWSFTIQGVVSQSPPFRASIVLSLAACSLSPLPNSFASSFPVGCPCGTGVLHKAFLSSPFLLTLLPQMT